jgi:hypothetical protein
MFSNRISGRLVRLERARAKREEAARRADPNHSPWSAKAVRAYNCALDRLDALAPPEGFSEELFGHLQFILEEEWRRCLESLRIFRPNEPKSAIAWFGCFADWFALVPAGLRVAALADLRRELEEPYGRHSHLGDWLRRLSFGRVPLPAGVTAAAVGAAVAAALDNAADLDDFSAYCTTCGLLCPLRDSAGAAGRPPEILERCPHCGTATRGPGGCGWTWCTRLGEVRFPPAAG